MSCRTPDRKQNDGGILALLWQRSGTCNREYCHESSSALFLFSPRNLRVDEGDYYAIRCQIALLKHGGRPHPLREPRHRTGRTERSCSTCC